MWTVPEVTSEAQPGQNQRAAQWWNSLRPVWTRVMPSSLQALITTSSAAEPAGAAMNSTPLWRDKERRSEPTRVRRSWRFRVSYPFGPIDVVSEGEEGVGAEGDAPQGTHPGLPLSVGQRLRDVFVHRLPHVQVWTLNTQNHRVYISCEGAAKCLMLKAAENG